MHWSLGEIVVTFGQLVAFAILLYGAHHYDGYDPTKAPSAGDMLDSLKRGKALPSPWKTTDSSNKHFAALFGLGFIMSAALLFFRYQLIDIVDHL